MVLLTIMYACRCKSEVIIVSYSVKRMRMLNTDTVKNVRFVFNSFNLRYSAVNCLMKEYCFSEIMLKFTKTEGY